MYDSNYLHNLEYPQDTQNETCHYHGVSYIVLATSGTKASKNIEISQESAHPGYR